MRRAQQQTITFTALDATTGAVMTGLTFSAGEVQITKDGGALANVANAVSELAAGVYALTLTAAETDAVWLHVIVRKTGVRPYDLGGTTSGQPSGAVVDDVTNSVTTFETDLTAATDDHWNGALLVFTSGSLAGQFRKVTDYTGATKFVTCAAGFTAEPSAGDRFLLVNI